VELKILNHIGAVHLAEASMVAQTLEAWKFRQRPKISFTQVSMVLSLFSMLVPNIPFTTDLTFG
jgi:hypothetical protein